MIFKIDQKHLGKHLNWKSKRKWAFFRAMLWSSRIWKNIRTKVFLSCPKVQRWSTIGILSRSLVRWNCSSVFHWNWMSVINIIDKLESDRWSMRVDEQWKNLHDELRFHSIEKTKGTFPSRKTFLSLRNRFFLVFTKTFLRFEKCSKLKSKILNHVFVNEAKERNSIDNDLFSGRWMNCKKFFLPQYFSKDSSLLINIQWVKFLRRWESISAVSKTFIPDSRSDEMIVPHLSSRHVSTDCGQVVVVVEDKHSISQFIEWIWSSKRMKIWIQFFSNIEKEIRSDERRTRRTAKSTSLVSIRFSIKQTHLMNQRMDVWPVSLRGKNLRSAVDAYFHFLSSTDDRDEDEANTCSSGIVFLILHFFLFARLKKRRLISIGFFLSPRVVDLTLFWTLEFVENSDFKANYV